MTPDNQKKILLKRYREEKNGQKYKNSTCFGALMAPPVTDSTTTDNSKTAAVVMAEISGHFFCRIGSGPDDISVSDSIIKFLNENAIFLPII